MLGRWLQRDLEVGWRIGAGQEREAPRTGDAGAEDREVEAPAATGDRGRDTGGVVPCRCVVEVLIAAFLPPLLGDRAGRGGSGAPTTSRRPSVSSPSTSTAASPARRTKLTLSSCPSRFAIGIVPSGTPVLPDRACRPGRSPSRTRHPQRRARPGDGDDRGRCAGSTAGGGRSTGLAGRGRVDERCGCRRCGRCRCRGWRCGHRGRGVSRVPRAARRRRQAARPGARAPARAPRQRSRPRARSREGSARPRRTRSGAGAPLPLGPVPLARIVRNGTVPEVDGYLNWQPDWGSVEAEGSSASASARLRRGRRLLLRAPAPLAGADRRARPGRCHRRAHRAHRLRHRARSTGRTASSTSPRATSAACPPASACCSSSGPASRTSWRFPIGARRRASSSARSSSSSFIRRFFKAPRLILTVVTIGLVAAPRRPRRRVLPELFDLDDAAAELPVAVRPPVLASAPTVFDGNEVVAMLAVPIVIAGLGCVPPLHEHRHRHPGQRRERRPRRAARRPGQARRRRSCGSSPPCSPPSAIFLRAGIVGLPIGSVLGPDDPHPGARRRGHRPHGAAARRSSWRRSPSASSRASIIFSDRTRRSLVDPILFVVVARRPAAPAPRPAAASTTTRRRPGRRRATSARSRASCRACPRSAGACAAAGGAARARAARSAAGARPTAQSTSPRVDRHASPSSAVSLVVLTGWAGQVSLGQVAFIGIGAAVGGVAHRRRWDWDLSVALARGGLVGAVAAMVIGLPALRIQGLFLAVVDARVRARDVVVPPQPRVRALAADRAASTATPLFGRIAIDTETRYYYLAPRRACCSRIVIVRGRAQQPHRAGADRRARERARPRRPTASTPSSAKLTAFAVSGFLAAAAGALFVHHQQSLGIQPYAVGAQPPGVHRWS